MQPLSQPFNNLKRFLTVCFVCLLSLSAFAQVPTVDFISPMSGPVGTVVTITGTQFSNTPANNIVYFGAVKATVTAATTTSLTVTVPAGATFEPISVTVNNLTAWSPKYFMTTFTGGGAITANSFRERVDTATGLYPYGIAIIDLDDDGKTDMATVNNGNDPAGTIAVFRNTGSKGVIAFAAAQYYPVPAGSTAYSIIAADIDGDGKKDLVTTNNVTNILSIYRNTSTPGAISLATRIDFATGSSPYTVAAGDLDKDGRADLAVANFFSNTISVYRNTSTPGNIALAAKTDLLTALSPHTVAIGDLDIDGQLDLVVTNSLSKSLSFFRNISTPGSISFVAKADLALGNDMPFGLAIGDLNADGRPELAVTNNNFNQVTEAAISLSILRNASNPGAFNFSDKTTYSTGDAHHVTINDLNGDGKPEVITCNMEDLKVYRNAGSLGSIAFTSPIAYYASSAYAVQSGDLDGDGRPDLAVANVLWHMATVFRNKQTEPAINSFTPASATTGNTITISGENLSGATAVTLGGQAVSSFTVLNAFTITAVVGAGASGNVSVTTPVGIITVPGFTFFPPVTLTSFDPAAAGQGSVVNITGTGFSNATAVSFGGIPATSFTVNSPTSISATVGAGASGVVSITTTTGNAQLAGFTFVLPPTMVDFSPKNGGSGTVVTITGTLFTGATAVKFGGIPAVSFTIVNPTTITAIVGDGITGNVSVTTPGGTVSLPGFVYPPPTITAFSPLSGPVGSSVTINGTGFSTHTAGNIVYLGAVRAAVTAASATSLTVTVPSGANYQPLAVHTKGMTAYARIPFAVTFPSTTSISPTTFEKILDSTKNVSPAEVEISDIDNDGKADVVQGGGSTHSLSVYRNTSSAGTILLAAPTVVATGDYPFTLTVKDISEDGLPDILATHYTNKTITIYRNTSTPGNISFAPKVVITTTGNTADIAAGDVDGDGRTDLAVITQFPHTIYVYRNIGINGTLAFDGGTKLEERQWFINRFVYLLLHDLDGDGKADLAVSDQSAQTISLYKNNSLPGTISFGTKTDLATFGGPDINASDLDGDNKPELLIRLENQTSILLNKTNPGGPFSFTPANEVGSSNSIFKMILSDVDGDGTAEIVASPYAGFALIKNLSTPGYIRFLNPVNYPLDAFGLDFASGDLDGDGKPELVLARDSRGLTVFRNRLDENYIASFTPSKTTTGKTVVITGQDFTGATAVRFGGVPAASFTVDDARTITAVLGNGGTGDVSVTLASGTTISKPGFRQAFPPSITSYTPAGGGSGHTITITGAGLEETSSVLFGNFPASSFTSVSSTTLTAVVGGGVSGDITVTTPYGTAKATGFFYVETPGISRGTITWCPSDSIVLYSSALTGNQWYKNNQLIAGATNRTYAATQTADYSVTATVQGITSRMSNPFTQYVPGPYPAPVITLDVVTGALVSSAETGNQWYIDTQTPIPGATQKTYKPGASGYYSVKATTNDGCVTPFANKFNYVLTPTIDLGAGNFLKLYPNPVKDLMVIAFELPGVYTVKLEVADMNGRILQTHHSVRNGDRVNLSGLSAGLYTIRIYSSNGKINNSVPVLKTHQR